MYEKKKYKNGQPPYTGNVKNIRMKKFEKRKKINTKKHNKNSENVIGDSIDDEYKSNVEEIGKSDIFTLQLQRKFIKEQLKSKFIYKGEKALYKTSREDREFEYDYDPNAYLYKKFDINSLTNIHSSLKYYIMQYNNRVEALWRYREKTLMTAKKMFNRNYGGDNFSFNHSKSTQTLKTVLTTIVDVEAGRQIKGSNNTVEKSIEFYDVNHKNCKDVGQLKNNNDNNKIRIGLELGFLNDYLYKDGQVKYATNSSGAVYSKDNNSYSLNRLSYERSNGISFCHPNDIKSSRDSKNIRNLVLKNILDTEEIDETTKNAYNDYINKNRQGYENITLKDIKFYDKDDKNIIVNLIKKLAPDNSNITDDDINNNIVKYTQDIFLDKKRGNIGIYYDENKMNKLITLLMKDKENKFKRILRQKDFSNYDDNLKKQRENVNYIVLGTNKQFLMAQLDKISNSIIDKLKEGKKVIIDYICSTHKNLEDTDNENVIMEEFKNKLKKTIMDKMDKTKCSNMKKNLQNNNVTETGNCYNGYHNTIETFETLVDEKSRVAEDYEKFKNSDIILCGLDSFAERAAIDISNSTNKKIRNMLGEGGCRIGFLSTDAYEFFKEIINGFVLPNNNNLSEKENKIHNDNNIENLIEKLKHTLKNKGAFGKIYNIFFDQNDELRFNLSNKEELQKIKNEIKAFILAQKLENYAKSIYTVNERYKNIVGKDKVTLVEVERNIKDITRNFNTDITIDNNGSIDSMLLYHCCGDNIKKDLVETSNNKINKLNNLYKINKTIDNELNNDVKRRIMNKNNQFPKGSSNVLKRKKSMYTASKV